MTFIDHSTPAFKGKIGDARLARRITVGLFASTLLIYLLFLTRNYYWDGIFFAQIIEDAPKLNRQLLHPNHLLYQVYEYLAFRAVRKVGFNVRSLTVLQVSNCIFGAIAASLLFRICLACFKRVYVSLVLTLLFAFSATWWRFCIDADSYILAVLLLLVDLYLISPARRPRPFAVAGVHVLALSVHQLSIFFFPAALLGIALQAKNQRDKRWIEEALKYGATVLLITVAMYYYCFYLATGTWSAKRFLGWITYFSPENGFAFSLWGNFSDSMRSQWRVFLGGRVAFVRELWGPRIILLTAAAILILAAFLTQLARYLKELKTGFAQLIQRTRQFRTLIILSVAWIVPYVIFLFFFIAQNAFYRLFYLPPMILLMGTVFTALEDSPAHIRRYRGALLAAVVIAANFAFSAYPYSQVRANPVTAFALKMTGAWRPGSVIYFGSLNSDNALIKYFNPSIIWIEAKPEPFGFQPGQSAATGDRWLDTTLIELFQATPGGEQWLTTNVVCPPETQLVNRKYKLKFCALRR